MLPPTTRLCRSRSGRDADELLARADLDDRTAEIDGHDLAQSVDHLRVPRIQNAVTATTRMLNKIDKLGLPPSVQDGSRPRCRASRRPPPFARATPRRLKQSRPRRGCFDGPPAERPLAVAPVPLGPLRTPARRPGDTATPMQMRTSHAKCSLSPVARRRRIRIGRRECCFLGERASRSWANRRCASPRGTRLAFTSARVSRAWCPGWLYPESSPAPRPFRPSGHWRVRERGRLTADRHVTRACARSTIKRILDSMFEQSTGSDRMFTSTTAGRRTWRATRLSLRLAERSSQAA